MLTRHTRTEGTSRRLIGGRWYLLLALLPAGIIQVLVTLRLTVLENILAALVGTILLIVWARRPATMLSALILILPFQLLILSYGYSLGIDGAVLRSLGLWKELAVLSVIVAGLVSMNESHRSFDALDRLGLAYVLLGQVYMVFQGPMLGGTAGGLSMDERFVSWRVAVLPVLFLLGARHCRLTADQLRRVLRAVYLVGLLLAIAVVLEFLISDSWNRFMVDTIQVNRFRLEVLDIDRRSLSGSNLNDVRYFTSSGRPRAGGPMISFLAFGFLLVVLLGFLLERLVRTERSVRSAITPFLVGFGILLTQTRSAMLGAGVVIATMIRAERGRATAPRVRFLLIAGVVVVLATPFAFSSGLTDRLTQGDAFSDQGHEIRRDEGFETLFGSPLGLGLGNGQVSNSRGGDGVSTENQFLDIGVQMGIGALLLFLAVGAALVIRLSRAGAAARDNDVQLGVFGARAAILGLVLPCWYLPVLLSPEVGWIVFGVAGAALGAAERSITERPMADWAS